MAITITKEDSDQVLNLSLCGSFSETDYQHALPEIQRAAREHGPIRVLLDIHHFNPESSTGAWERFFAALNRSLGVERLAFVGEPPIRDWMRQFAHSLKGAKVGYFSPDQCWVAQCWLGK